ncbi:MAG: DNA topoisomerase IB [Anaerolineae bacterium]|nr:DNA topoisomerase IB [Anaerolineae bacterium]
MTNQIKPALIEDTPLRYIGEDEPGYSRLKWGRGFTYRDCEGETITDADERSRIEALAIPPAWTDVWICSDPNGHILATGRDSKGRKQYIYHPDWQAQSSQHKFQQLTTFGRSLPAIRQQTEADMRKHQLSREKVLAVVVRLLEKTLIRIGNTCYMQHNESYGLTTMQDEHVAIAGKRISFEFTGKSGVEHEVDLEDKRLAAIVQACQDIPGHRLFQYYDEGGNRQRIESGDVNDYLREITGGDFSAKDFRTWGATTYMVKVLSDAPSADDEKELHQIVVDAVKEVAELLGNTPAVCRNYYIHPAVMDAFEEGKLRALIEKQPRPDSSYALDQYEAALMALID